MSNKYKVLIVEDDPMVAMINEQYIKRNKNFEIIGKCNDGLSALDFLEKISHLLDKTIRRSIFKRRRRFPRRPVVAPTQR